VGNEKIDLATMWNEFGQCLQAAQDTTIHQNIHVLAIAAPLHTMGAFLRFPVLMKFVNKNDLEMNLSFVLMQVPANSKSGDEAVVVSDFQIDAIEIIGMLSSEPRPSTIHEHILCEVLNALMDIYSADEGDANRLLVMQISTRLVLFLKSVLIFKKKICGHDTKEKVN
jgi:hypothetical protein